MEPHGTNWTPGLIALGVAAFAALIFLLRSRSAQGPAPGAVTPEDLETRYQAALGALKEHVANKHLVPPEAWAAENARLEQAAAAVLREKAGVQHEALKAQARAEKKAAAAAQPSGMNPMLKGALWGGGVVGFFVVLGIVLSQESKERVDGQEMTGTIPTGGAGPMQNRPPQEDLELKTAIERANRSPDDIDALSDAARELIGRQMWDDAAPIVRRATSIDPYHVPTRTHRAVLSAVEGQTSTALDELVHIADTFDDAYDARLFAGMLALQNNDHERALVQFERYSAEAPVDEQPPMIGQAITQLRAERGARPPPMPTVPNAPPKP